MTVFLADDWSRFQGLNSLQRGWALYPSFVNGGTLQFARAFKGKALQLDDSEGRQIHFISSGDYAMAAARIYVPSTNGANAELRIGFGDVANCAAADLIFVIKTSGVTVDGNSFSFDSTYLDRWLKVLCGICHTSGKADLWIDGDKKLDSVTVTYVASPPTYARLSAHLTNDRDEIKYDSAGFEAYDLGNLTGQGGWTGPVGTGVLGSGQVQNSIKQAGTKAVQWGSKDGDMLAYTPCVPANNLVIEFDVYFASSGGAERSYIRFRDRNGNYTTTTAIMYFTDTALYWPQGNNTAINVDTWYAVKMVLKTSGSNTVVDCYLDGDLKYSDVTLGSANFKYGINFYSATFSGAAEGLYIDNLVVTEDV